MTGISVSEQANSPGKLLWEGNPTFEAAAPHFIIDDNDAEIIARFEDGSAAVAEKDLDGCRSIYAALYQLPSGLLRTLLAESGVFLYSRNSRVYTYANHAFLGVYNATEDMAEVSVKTDGMYYDYICGETFTAVNGILQLPKRDIRAYLLVLQK